MGKVMTMPDGTTFEFVRSPADPEKDPSEMVFTAQPNGPAPPPHVHPRQRETFTCEEGDFELLVDGEWRTLPPGESLTVQPGQVHTYRNEGARTARVRTCAGPRIGSASTRRSAPHASTGVVTGPPARRPRGGRPPT